MLNATTKQCAHRVMTLLLSGLLGLSLFQAVAVHAADPTLSDGALIPIVPFLTPAPLPEAWAYGAAAATAMLLGAVKARYTRKGPVRSGLELLGIVTIGTVAGVVIGFVLQTF